MPPTASKPRIAVYAGSFNPFHAGHLAITKKACALFDYVYVVVARNSAKAVTTDRHLLVDNINQTLKEAQLTNASARAWDGYTVTLAHALGAQYLVRSVRNDEDVHNEMLVAAVNQQLAAELQTVLFVADKAYEQISSSKIRETIVEQVKVFGDLPK